MPVLRRLAHPVTRRRSTLAVATFLLTLGVIAAGPPAGAATTLYVGGPVCADNGNRAGTQLKPFCTIGAAARVAVAGDTVVVAAGTYAEMVTPRYSGTALDRITYMAAPGARPIVTGSTRGFYLSGTSYVTVRGFMIADTSDSGIYSSKGTGIVIEDNVVTRSGLRIKGYTAYGIYLNSTSNSVIRRNVVDDNSASGIYLSSGANNNLVDRNVSTRNANGWMRSAVGIDLRGVGNTVVHNIVHSNEDTGIQAYPGGDNSLIAGNLAYDSMGFTTDPVSNCSPPSTGNTSGCILGDHGIDNYGATGTRIIGNTVYGNTAAGINVEGLSLGVATGIVVENNISGDNAMNCPDGLGGTTKCPRTKGNVRVDSTSGTGTVLDRNLYYLSETGGYPGNYQLVYGANWYTWSQFANVPSETGQEVNGLAADPLWADLAGRDFHLTAGSPAIDRGASIAGGQDTDLDGEPRVDDPASGGSSGDIVDLGADEYVPPAAGPTSGATLGGAR